MGDLFSPSDQVPPYFSTGSRNSAGASVGGGSVNAMSAAVAWGAANLALFAPFVLGAPFTVQKMWWVNGATVGTNHVDVGIYDSQGNQILHSGSTLTSGVSVLQSVSVTATTLNPGLYYAAMAMDGTTDRVRVFTASLQLLRAGGLLQMSTAFPLPAPAVFAQSTTAQLPFIGITSETVI